MVLGIFKSKEQRNKDKLKKELKGKISSIGQGGGRNKQSTKKRLQRELKSLDAPKKEEKKGPRVGGAQGNKRKRYGNNQTGGGASSSSSSSKSSKSNKNKSGQQLSNYEMRKAERITASREVAKGRHTDWKKMKSGGMSREDFIKKYPRSQTAKKYGKK